MNTQEFKFNHQYNYNSYDILQNDEQKELEFLQSLEQFNCIYTLTEAKNLIKTMFPQCTQELNRLYIGNIECIIRLEANALRISYNSPNEFKAYCYSYPKKEL